jgi:hypothetical protein
MDGIEVFCGPDARAPIVPVFTDAWPVPSELRAVTTTSIRLPRSASLSVIEREVARFVQLAICALQTHPLVRVGDPERAAPRSRDSP